MTGHPAAKADAARLRQGAEAYRNEVIARAEGEAERFSRSLSAKLVPPENHTL